MSSANDYSRLGVVNQDDTHDYAAVMAYAKDERNWFKRARGEWVELDAQETAPAGMRTTITVVDGADGLTPDMLRKRPTPEIVETSSE